LLRYVFLNPSIISLTYYTVNPTPEALSSLSCTSLLTTEAATIFSTKEAGLLRRLKFSSRNLSITSSELHSLDFLATTDLQRITTLDLSNNRLETLELSSHEQAELQFPSVIRLNLSGNRLRSLGRNAFLPFPNVEEVDVSRNELFSVDWEALRLFKLRRRSLEWNRLPMISDHMLRFTPNLEAVDLSHNQLATIQSSSCFAAQRLKEIDLSFNRIQHFNYDSFSPLFQVDLNLWRAWNVWLIVVAGLLAAGVSRPLLQQSDTPATRPAAVHCPPHIEPEREPPNEDRGWGVGAARFAGSC